MTTAMWAHLPELLEKARVRRNLRALWLRGTDHTFCSGADVQEFFSLAKNTDLVLANQAHIEQAQSALAKFPLPTLALIEGDCFGGGLALALSCDFRIASTDSRFAVTPARLGLTYSLMSTRRLYRAVGDAVCREMLLAARVLDGTQALDCRLVNQLATADQLEVEAQNLTRQLADLSPFSQSAIKRTLNSIEGISSETEEVLHALMLSAFEGADFQEGTRAFLEKRKAVFRRS